MFCTRFAIRLQKCTSIINPQVTTTRLLNPKISVFNQASIKLRETSFWSNVEMGKPDPVYGITTMFDACRNPKKVNLSMGAYQDDNGKPYVLPCVRKAEKLLDVMRLDKEYSFPEGDDAYCREVERIVLGRNSEHAREGLTATTQTVSRTGACRVAFDFIKAFYAGIKRVHLPAPTWGNHSLLARHSGMEIDYYRYYDNKTFGLDYKGLMDDVSKIPNQAIILFHACAHNPTGVDPSRTQWEEMSDLVLKKQLLVLFDCSYHGFASGHFEVDAYAVRRFVEDGNHCVVIQSFCKNMGLYGDRPGGLIIIAKDKGTAEKMRSQIRNIVIPMYRTPPIHGSRIAVKILTDTSLKDEWKRQFKLIADRIISIRRILRNKLIKEGSIRNWDHIVNQNGMFCFTGLTKSQVKKLQDEHSIFMSDAGRISIGQLNTRNVDYVAHAIHLITRYIK